MTTVRTETDLRREEREKKVDIPTVETDADLRTGIGKGLVMTVIPAGTATGRRLDFMDEMEETEPSRLSRR